MVQIDPTEKRDQHLKTYVEPSVLEAVKEYQEKFGFFSISEATRDLVINALNINQRSQREHGLQ